MTSYRGAVVDPDNVRSSSVVATVTTILLGLAWLLGEWWCQSITSFHLQNVFEDGSPYITIPLSLALWGGFLIAGLMWAMWQRNVALVAAMGEGVRDPDWHARAWFSSVVMWWEPLRNVRELSSHLLGPRHRWLVSAWWVAWIAFRLVVYVTVWQLWGPRPLSIDPYALLAVSVVVTVTSTVLAVVLIRRLTSAALAKAPQRTTIQYVPRPVRFSLALFVVGLLCRIATPIAVIAVPFWELVGFAFLTMR